MNDFTFPTLPKPKPLSQERGGGPAQPLPPAVSEGRGVPAACGSGSANSL
jgi:hypothetical protein